MSSIREEIDEAVRGKTLCSVFEETVRRHADEPALRWRGEKGWDTCTWTEYREHVRCVAAGLLSLGLESWGQRRTFALILSRNRPEHVIFDLAVLHAGGTPVSLYNTLAGEQIAYIANHCEAEVAFVEDAAFLDRLLSIRADLPRLKHIIVLDPPPRDLETGVTTYDDLLGRGRELLERSPEAFDEAWKKVTADDLCTLVYTSGTTGQPKAVMDTHRAVLWMAESCYRVDPIEPGRRTVAYLPLAHAAERTGSHWNGIAFAGITYFCPDPTQVLGILKEVRPTQFVGVPRVWEKIRAGIMASIEAEPDPDKRRLIEAALAAGRERTQCKQEARPVPAELEAKLAKLAPVYAGILAKVGLDACDRAVSGAAPIATRVIEFFHALGLEVVEVWGMTELGCAGTINPKACNRIGSVGPAIPGAEVKVAADGELLYRGGNVMTGYYRDPEGTCAAIDEEGWVHTGDIGTIDADGYVRIVDRKKELIITSAGKNISPANLESMLKEHPLVGHACVVGDGQPFVAALVVLDPEVAPAWARARGLPDDLDKLAAHPTVRAEIESVVNGVNARVARVEQIKRFALLGKPWTLESGELTPTLKMKRRVVHARHRATIEQLYRESQEPQRVSGLTP